MIEIFFDFSIPSCSSNLNDEYNHSSQWISNYESNSFIKSTGFRLTPPMANPGIFKGALCWGKILVCGESWYFNGFFEINNEV